MDRQTLIGTWVVLLLLAVPLPGRAQEESPLLNLVSIEVFEHEVQAISGGGSGPSEGLDVGETVVQKAVRGAVGLAITNRRLLAVSSTSAAWQSTRMGPREKGPMRMLLGDRVALAVTSRRVIGFEARSSNLVETRLGPKEASLGLAIGANVGMVVTDRRVLALSSWAGGIFEFPLGAREEVESLEASADFGIVRTERRLVTFNGRTGTYTEKRLGLGR